MLDFIFPDVPACVYCGASLPMGDACESCEKTLQQNRLQEPIRFVDFLCHSAYGYHEQISTLIQGFKFDDRQYYSAYLAREMARVLRERNVRFDLITAVPLHKKREKFRGYNQAALIADALAEIYGSEKRNILKRIKNTKPQSLLERSERQANVRDAFVLEKDADVFGKKILLVDDVITVGATMQNCVKVLLESGAKEVVAATFAAAIH